MRNLRRLTTVASAVAALVTLATPLGAARAQGVTTGAIAGRVTGADSAGLEAVQIQIVNRATGFTTGSITREWGRFLVQGLEVGGPYSVTARRIGFAPQTRDSVRVGLSQTTRIDFVLTAQATQLSSVTVRAAAGTESGPTNTGTRTTVSDTAIQRLPTITRNLTDFVRLTPQVSQSGPGFSGGGMSNRMNDVQIDGASERDVFGLGSTGVLGAEVNAKAVSIEAVKAFQVLLAPFERRRMRSRRSACSTSRTRSSPRGRTRSTGSAA